jgi:uncharacterized membrane protein
LSGKTFAFVGFKLIGFWFMVQAASSLAGVPSVIRPPSWIMPGQLVSLFLLPTLATGVVGVATWSGAGWLAARVSESADTGDQKDSASVVGSSLVLALAILGAWLTAWAIPELVNGLALFVISRGGTRSVLGTIDYSQSEQALVWSTSAQAAVLGAAARAAVGLLLVLRAHKVATLFGPNSPDADDRGDDTLEDEGAGGQ